MIAGPPAGVVVAERRIVERFRAAGATSREHATTTAALGIHEGLAFRILCRRAVLRDAGEQRLYLDEPTLETLRAMRRRLAVMLIGIGLLLLTVTILWTSRR